MTPVNHLGVLSCSFFTCPSGAMVKNQPAIAGDEGDTGSIPEWGRSPAGRNGKPL